MKKIGILAAMATEISHFEKVFPAERVIHRGNADFNIAKNIVYVKCGIGKVHAAVATQILCDMGVTHLINTGIAGALHPALKIFDLVVSSDAVQYDVDVTAFDYPRMKIPGCEESFSADDFLISCAHSAAQSMKLSMENFSIPDDNSESRVFTGRIATGDKFVSNLKLKNEIRDFSGGMCVEMEGGAVAQVAHLNACPFVILRCISDMAAEDTAEYKFNEATAGDLSARFVEKMLDFI